MERDADFWEVSWKFEGEDFEILRELVDELTVAAQENIFEQGDPSDGMYLVLEGYALVIREEKSGAQQTVGIVSEGQSFGELGLLIEQPRLGTVAAGTEVKLLKITPEQLTQIETNAPRIASTLYKQLARTLAEQMVSRGLIEAGNES